MDLDDGVEFEAEPGMLVTAVDVMERLNVLQAQMQFVVDYMDEKGMLEEHCFTFPDGETIYASSVMTIPVGDYEIKIIKNEIVPPDQVWFTLWEENVVETERVSVFNEPYKAVVEDHRNGVKIVVTAQAEDDTDAGRAEADRRAKLIVDHFKIIVGRT